MNSLNASSQYLQQLRNTSRSYLNDDEIKEAERSDNEEDEKRILNEVLEAQEARKLAMVKLPSKKLPPVPQVKELLAAHI